MAVPALAVQRRDLVVIGTSAGGVDALPKLLAQLPARFDASVIIVQHLGPREAPLLVHILQRASALPVTWAEQGERILPGRVYVAPPDTHLTVREQHLRLTSGPHENFARPSIDKLFRSAVAHYGPRVIGVLLTGTMADGVAGLHAIAESAGRTIVQDPQDAMFGELPARALAVFEPNATLPLEQIGAALVAMTSEHVELDRAQQKCPECGGRAARVRDLLDTSDDQLQTALWSAVRALHEQAATWESLSNDPALTGASRVATDYARRARDAREQAEIARKFMLDLLCRSR